MLALKLPLTPAIIEIVAVDSCKSLGFVFAALEISAVRTFNVKAVLTSANFALSVQDVVASVEFAFVLNDVSTCALV